MNNRPTNKEIIGRYLNYYQHSQESFKMREHSLKYFFDEKYYGYNGHSLDISMNVLKDYHVWLKSLDNISLNTKRNKWAILKSFVLSNAEDYNETHGYMVIIPKRNVDWGVNHKKPNSNKREIATIEEIETLLEYFRSYHPDQYIIFRTLIETGMRQGELRKIEISGVNFDDRFIETTGKTGDKIYYMSEGLAELLRFYLNSRIAVKTNKFFVNRRGVPYNSRLLNLFLSKARESLEIKRTITCHTFRRTLNTLRKKMDCSNEDRKILLNHKTGDVNIESYTILEYDNFIALYDKYNPYLEARL